MSLCRPSWERSHHPMFSHEFILWWWHCDNKLLSRYSRFQGRIYRLLWINLGNSLDLFPMTMALLCISSKEFVDCRHSNTPFRSVFILIILQRIFKDKGSVFPHCCKDNRSSIRLRRNYQGNFKKSSVEHMQILVIYHKTSSQYRIQIADNV